MITKLLHDITQAGFRVNFEGDFSGMLTVSFFEEHVEKDYIRHEHIGYPDCSSDDLEIELTKCLNKFYNEVKDGNNPNKDGLST